MLSDVAGEIIMDPALMSAAPDTAPKAPGMKYRHYAPKAAMTVYCGETRRVTEKIRQIVEEYVAQNQYQPEEIGILATEESEADYPLGQVVSAGSRKKNTVGRHIYGALRRFDELQVRIILSESFYDCDKEEAIMNRLLKAAGQNRIQVSD
jgi:L-threonylcarbamoyladenylate synthase